MPNIRLAFVSVHKFSIFNLTFTSNPWENKNCYKYSKKPLYSDTLQPIANTHDKF